MSTEDPGNGDLLLERLKQSAAGDPAVRQLRRRYDLLRHDYEALIDRLGELEDRLAAGAEEPPHAAAPPLPPPPPTAAAAEPGASSLHDTLMAPLLKLRDEYVAAANGIQAIVSGLDGLAAAAFKGQRPAGTSDEALPVERPRLKPARIQVDVKGGGFGELLDFQEHLSELPGVARVSINAIDNERATLVVELSSTTPGD